MNKAVQGRIIGLMVLFVVFVAILFVVLNYTWRGGTILPTLFRLLLALILVLVGVVYTGLRFSQRIVGPIHAFAQTLGEMNRGEYTNELRLRQHDQFQNLAKGFNQTMENLRQRVREDILFLDALAGQIEGMRDLDPESKEAMLKRIREYRGSKDKHLMKRTQS